MAMHLHFILLCLMPDDFTRQVESACNSVGTFTVSLCQKKPECAVTCRHQLRQEVLTLQLAIKYQHFTSN
jgi:hypothetical protein